MSEADLAMLVTRDAMIGVAQVASPVWEVAYERHPRYGRHAGVG